MAAVSLDFAQAFARLAEVGERETTSAMGGVNVRLVRVPGGGEGSWDRHATTAESAIVWSGDFAVEFRDGTVLLGPGQCCVVPAGADHRATSKAGAEIILFTNAAAG